MEIICKSSIISGKQISFQNKVKNIYLFLKSLKKPFQVDMGIVYVLMSEIKALYSNMIYLDFTINTTIIIFCFFCKY